jgi:hypothetical protein
MWNMGGPDSMRPLADLYRARDARVAQPRLAVAPEWDQHRCRQGCRAPAGNFSHRGRIADLVLRENHGGLSTQSVAKDSPVNDHARTARAALLSSCGCFRE